MADVILKELVKSFKTVTAVDHVNLEIKDKEFMVFVGPSGCGKTTCLRMIAGLEEATSGEIYIENKLVNDVSPKDRDIAMVFQNYALYPHMSVFDNMAFALKLARIPKDEIAKRVNEAAKLLGLSEMLNRKPKQLSGGQRQRVALGRAIVREPAVFLMDEPLSNLDAKLRVQTRSELIKLHRRLGITTIYVTHDQVEAMTMGDRIMVMNAGVVQQVDTPLGLYNHPTNKFVAGFIGTPSMNFLDVKIVDEGGKYIIDGGSFKVTAPKDKAELLKPYIGKEVIFGIRPEDIFDKNLTNLVSATPDNTITAKLDVMEPMGPVVTMYLKSDNHSLVATIDAETKAKETEAIELVLDMDKTHIFEKDTEKAVY